MRGKVVETHTVVHEPEWLDDDLEAALEWQEYKDSLCPGCGQPRHESFDFKNRDRYEVEVLRCFSCMATQVESRIWSKDEAAELAGAYFVAKDKGDAVSVPAAPA